MRVSWCDSALMMEYTATCDRLWWLKSRTVMPWKICCKAVAGKQTGKNKMPNEIKFVSILCLSSRTTVMSACIPEKDAYYHARNMGVFSHDSLVFFLSFLPSPLWMVWHTVTLDQMEPSQLDKERRFLEKVQIIIPFFFPFLPSSNPPSSSLPLFTWEVLMQKHLILYAIHRCEVT